MLLVGWLIAAAAVVVLMLYSIFNDSMVLKLKQFFSFPLCLCVCACYYISDECALDKIF